MRYLAALICYLLFAPFAVAGTQTVTLGGPTAGSGAATCTGTYTATVQDSKCSNSFLLSDSFSLTGLGTNSQGSLQGSANFSNFIFTEVFLPNGSCAKQANSSTNLSLSFGSSWNGSTGSLSMTTVNNEQLTGALAQPALAQLSGSFKGAVWGPNVQGTFNCTLQDNNPVATPGPFLLAVTRAGTGSGNVVSAPVGIDCGSNCSKAFSNGTLVTLTAGAASGSYFSGWSGACSGKSACSVTMDAAKGVIATFTINPFAVLNNSIITPTRILVETVIQFKQSYIGKRGYVFVTARVPKAALGSVLKKTSADQTMTQSDAVLDSSSTILVQETTSGWQLVENGQLLPYASGVLGDQIAAQTILDTTDTSNLTGAEFCIGYGTSAAEMTASGNMVPVADVPDSGGSSTDSCVISGSSSAAVLPLTGLWWNANESGWGMSITQSASTLFAAWYTYDSGGNPTWYTMSSCPLVGNGCTGDIYKVSGGAQPDLPWSKQVAVTKIGSGALNFSDNDTAVFNYTLNGASGIKNISRQIFSSGSAQPTIDYSALWWNPAESGWGLSFAQQYDVIFISMYVYDANGKPIWYVASNCALSGSGCSGDLYQVSGGTEPNVAWNGANKTVAKVGAVSVNFSDASNASLSYTINGANVSKTITRNLF